MKYLLAVLALFLAACVPQRGDQASITEVNTNPLVEAAVDQNDTTDLRRRGITTIIVSCVWLVAESSSHPNAKGHISYSYWFQYGTRTVDSTRECPATHHYVMRLDWWPGGRYSNAQYTVKTAENYPYETVKEFIQFVYDDISKNSKL